jgi:hypothetical protein
MGKIENAFSILIRNPKGNKRLLGKPKHRWKGNTKIHDRNRM